MTIEELKAEVLTDEELAEQIKLSTTGTTEQQIAACWTLEWHWQAVGHLNDMGED